MTYRFTGGGEGRFSYQVHGVTAGGVHPAVSMTGENVALCLVNVVWPTPVLPRPSDAFLSVPGVPTDHRGCGRSCGTAWVFGWVANGRGRLMRLAGIAGITRRKTTYRRHRRVGEVSADLVDRQFSPTEPDRLWLADITQHPTRGGIVYLAVVMDAWNREVIGWSIANHIRAQIVCDAFEMARWRRRPRPQSGLVHHLRPRRPIYVLGVREETAPSRDPQINGKRRRRL